MILSIQDFLTIPAKIELHVNIKSCRGDISRTSKNEGTVSITVQLSAIALARQRSEVGTIGCWEGGNTARTAPDDI